MADEFEQSPDQEAPSENQAPAPMAAPEPEPAETKSSGGWSGTLLGLAGLAVVLTAVGVFGQMKKDPDFLALGLGLILWGVLDLVAQRRGLIVWRGAKAVIGNTMNLVRGLALLGLGLWLALMAVGTIPPTSTAVLSNVGLGLLVGYLGVSLALEAFVKGLNLSAQAFLIAALALQFVSYLYFSIPFTYGWAAVFAALAFGAGAWAIFGGVLSDTPALSRAVLIATLLLGAPLATYTAEQMFSVHEQPLFTPTLLIPRMRQLVGPLSEDAGQIKWAPVHTQLGQPGDVPFSDKLAFTDYVDDEPGIGLYLQKEDKSGHELVWVETGEEADLTSFSQDGRLLAFTHAKKEGDAPSLGVLEPRGEFVNPWPEAELADAAAAEPKKDLKDETRAEKRKRLKKEKAAKKNATAMASYVVKHPYPGSVATGPSHGQVWRGLGKQLYFAGPPSTPLKPGGAVFSAAMKERRYERLRENRGMPAISPDGTRLLSVGFSPNERYLEMADGASGERNRRVFSPLQEKRYFPAWNASQTRILFIKSGKLNTMKSNGTDQQVFDPQALDSRLWFSDKTVPFTLQWKESGNRWRIYRSGPDGKGEKLIYEAEGKSISPPQWSADGNRVGLVVSGAEAASVVTVDWDGKWARQSFKSGDPITELQWSPDGLKLAWLVKRAEEGTYEAWTTGVQGLEPHRVLESRGVLSGLSWAPGGKYLAVEEKSEWRFLGLRLVKPDIYTVQMVDLVNDKAGVMTRYGIMSKQPSFSPQGVALAYFSDYNPWTPGLRRERRTSLVISQLY
jgi:Tol biopolymer transport system component